MPTPYKLKILNGVLKLKTFSDHVLSILGIKDLGTQTGDVTNGYVDWSIQHLTKTTAQWSADTTTILLRGQLGVEDTGNNTFKIKIGNGTDLWSALGYAGGSSSSVWGGITGTLSDQTDLQNALNNKQDLDSDLTAIAGLTPSNDDIIQRKAGSWINRTLAQLWVDLKDLTVTLTNKTLAVGSNSITGTASRVAQFGAGGSLEASSVTTTQLSYLDATSSIQTQLDNRSTLLAKNNIQTTHTGTTSETLILSYELTGLLALNDLLKTNFRIYPNNTANNKTVRIKVNSSASLVGASTLGTYTFTSSCINFIRSLWFENSLASIKSMYPTSSISNDETVLSNILGLNSTTFDFTGPVFILITAQLTVSTDTLYFLNGEIIRKR